MGKAYAMLAPSSDNIIDLGPIKKKRKKKKGSVAACSLKKKKNGNTDNFFVAPRVKQEEVSFCRDPDNSVRL